MSGCRNEISKGKEILSMSWKIVCRTDAFTCGDIQSEKRAIKKACLDFCQKESTEDSPLTVHISKGVLITSERGIEDVVEIEVYACSWTSEDASEGKFWSKNWYDLLAERLKELLGEGRVSIKD